MVRVCDDCVCLYGMVVVVVLLCRSTHTIQLVFVSCWVSYDVIYWPNVTIFPFHFHFKLMLGLFFVLCLSLVCVCACVCMCAHWIQ